MKRHWPKPLPAVVLIGREVEVLNGRRTVASIQDGEVRPLNQASPGPLAWLERFLGPKRG